MFCVEIRLKLFWADDVFTKPIFAVEVCAGIIFAEDCVFGKIVTPPVPGCDGRILTLEAVLFCGRMFMFEIDGLFGKILIVDVGVGLDMKAGCCLIICIGSCFILI